MRLEDIGFYTLSDERAKNASATSPLWRCELLITDRCNLRCPYCRGLPGLRGEMTTSFAMNILDWWIAEGLKNVRFSGGEPTLHDGLGELVDYCRRGGVERIAISTNGTADLSMYHNLVDRGVNDLSISLDGGCCAVGDKMAGCVLGTWHKAVKAIQEMSRRTYVSVGMVFTEENVASCVEAVLFASRCGVADIRVIPAAQYASALRSLIDIPDVILERYPILQYRVQNAVCNKPMRGLGVTDSRRCCLALDDMAVAGNWHYPCVIYLREGGEPIGRIGRNMRQSRQRWVDLHDTLADPICSKNCLDVCVAYNNASAPTGK